MSLLLLLFFPIIIGLVGMIIWQKEITWKEFLAQEVAVILLIVIAFGITAQSRVMDTEIWNGKIANKNIERTGCCHSYPCNCRETCSGTGSNRSCSMTCDTCYSHSHDKKYIAETTNGEIAYVDSCNAPSKPIPKRYEEIVVGEPTSIEHKYKNYIKGVPDTILVREEVTKEFKIPEYPDVYDHYRVKRFLGIGVNVEDEWDKRLDEINADLGKRKQVNIIVIATEEEDSMYFEKLKQEWLGGKKNDFIVVIGTDGIKIKWANVLSWSDAEEAKVFTKNRITELGEFKADEILTIIEEEVEQKFVRKEMEDFKYLKARIEPTGKSKFVIFIIGIIMSLGLTWLFKEEDIF